VRLGLHLNGPGYRDRVRAYIDAVRPPVIKMLAEAYDPGLVDYCHERGVKVVCRRVQPITRLGAQGWRDIRVSLDWAAARGWKMDYLEFANEEWQGHDNPRDWDRLSALMLDAMRHLDQNGHGVRACIYNTSVGQPELERWRQEECEVALHYAGRHGHVIGLHEYYRPTPWYGSEGRWQDWGRVWGWWMLRCRRVVDIWRMQGIAVPGFIVTESGRDDIVGTPGEGKGYRDDPAPYVGYMTDYCRHLSAIPECKGVVDFGWDGTPSGWATFDLATDTITTAELVHSMRQLPRGHGMTDSTLRALAAEAQAHQAIQYNPGAAIQKEARGRGWQGPSPNSGEWRTIAPGLGGQTAQRYEWPDGRVEVATWNPATGAVTWHDITAIVVPGK